MALTIEEIAKAIAELPRPERLALIRLLLDLDPPSPREDVQGAWDAELRSRIKAIDDGRADGVPYEQIKSDMTGRFPRR
jgi:putative addiction module component (TIGR02574 family)